MLSFDWSRGRRDLAPRFWKMKEVKGFRLFRPMMIQGRWVIISMVAITFEWIRSMTGWKQGKLANFICSTRGLKLEEQNVHLDTAYQSRHTPHDRFSHPYPHYFLIGSSDRLAVKSIGLSFSSSPNISIPPFMQQLRPSCLHDMVLDFSSKRSIQHSIRRSREKIPCTK